MTPIERDIVRQLLAKFLGEHRGAEHARRGQDLAKDLGTDYNKIRQCVHYLRERGHAIGNATGGKVRGYYLIQTPEEAKHSLADLRSRAVENWVQHNALAKAIQQSLNVEVEQLRLGE